MSHLRPQGLESTRLLYPWNSLGENAGVGIYTLLQGIFLTQGETPGLLHCKQILYQQAAAGINETAPVTVLRSSSVKWI